MNLLQTKKTYEILQAVSHLLDNGRGAEEIAILGDGDGDVLWSNGVIWFEFNPLENAEDCLLLIEHFKIDIEHLSTISMKGDQVSAEIWGGLSFERAKAHGLKEVVFEVTYQYINNRELRGGE